MLSLASMMIPEAVVGGVIYFASVVLYPVFDSARPFGRTRSPTSSCPGPSCGRS